MHRETRCALYMDAIQNEIDFYKSRRLEFIAEYPGKHLVIKGMQVTGIYDTRTQAFDEATKLYEAGTFIIEHPVDIAARLQLVKKR
jgi:hypothetical protein